MTTKNKRIKAPALTTRIEFDIHVGSIATMTTELRAMEAERDADIQLAQQTNAIEIGELQEIINAKASLCEKYADEHRAELLPGKIKSAETPLARFGFRLGNRTVALLKKGCSWDAAVIILKSLKLAGTVRTVEEVNKETILARTNDDGQLATSDEELAKGEKAARMPLSTIGLKINQSESFFIEPKVEGAETVKVA